MVSNRLFIKFVLKTLSYNLNPKQQLFAKNKIGIENLIVESGKRMLPCLRFFADDIFIFGLVSKTILEKIEIKLAGEVS